MMKSLIQLAKKVLKRFWRIITFRPGVYCKFGKGNNINRHVFLHENATIGNYNYVGSYTQMLNVSVGNYCSFAPGARLGPLNHDYNCVSTSTHICGKKSGVRDFDMIDLNKPTIIENDVWLGANVCVKQGVTVSTGAVVGAGSVVTKDIPPYEIWGGVPARFIKKRFSDDNIHMLLDSKWWELDPKAAVVACKELQDKIEA